MLAHMLRRPRMLAVLPCCVGLALTGCTGRLEPTTRPSFPQTDVSPTGNGTAQSGTVATVMPDGRYPLRTGNRWEHRLTRTFRLVPEVGEPPPDVTIESVVQRRQVGPVVLGGRIYMVEEITSAEPHEYAPYPIHYRQDASGLYEYVAIRRSGRRRGTSHRPRRSGDCQERRVRTS